MIRVFKSVRAYGATAVLIAGLSFPGIAKAQGEEKLNVTFAFGHKSTLKTVKSISLRPGSENLTVTSVKARNTEGDDKIGAKSVLNFGSGDIDELLLELNYSRPSAVKRKVAQHNDDYSINGDGMWGYLMEKGSPGQIARLKQDQWNQPDAPILTVQLNEAGTEGFSIALDNLLKHGAMWLPEQDVYVAIQGKGNFKKHLASLKGKRTIDQVHNSPDASLNEFTKRWADFGNPNDWDASWQTRYMGTGGHLTVTAATHGAIYKYAIDRWANVRPDFASPYKFRLNLLLPEATWKGQKIDNGLPIVLTNLQKNEQQFIVEQLASPIGDASEAIRGYIPSVLLTKLTVSGKAGSVNFGFVFNNEKANQKIIIKDSNGVAQIQEASTNKVLLTLESQGLKIAAQQNGLIEKGQQITFNITGNITDGESKSVIVKLPSPNASAVQLSEVKYEAYKTATKTYWENWLNEGAQFNVPEPKVNELYRANLWHSLVLPRHTINDKNQQHMDLPYANTAYGQKDADWPINQAVYVDYLVYGLRGYETVATDEIKAMFQSQQQKDGRIGGFANWGVYSPGHLYTIAQNYLLSHNKEQFELLLPEAIKTLDFCLAQIKKADSNATRTGLILGALNDLTHAEREWAFTQAYYVGGLKQFARALKTYGHNRADEVNAVAAKMKTDVVNEFARSSVKSPVVQLADGSWINYVPTDAMTPRRMMEQWYPTDVDCGPLHLSRLGVFEPDSWLTTAMLNDHEDNLFLLNNGAANEPVYVQQGNAYLLRDDPKAVIRAFYSMMACAFSHEQYTSLEHRWAWGQYYGPPSTDGAWFELYRRMLINEFGDDTLMIGQAIPRDWLAAGKKIDVKNAPTNFGPISLSFEGVTTDGIKATIDLSDRNPPKQLLVRFRHPQGKTIRSVEVDGKPWKEFDAKKEFVIISAPTGKLYSIIAKF
ncbi:MAG: hypothetical protein EOO02_05890 [Chitinophagaceae bacterium]|nr:MAG: hypothetical protein EOO02_05890 [Chitinophagaceae bacterium]